ncbi:hypothetical protein [Micromonospora coxensis]|uniref:hypothetical protein n=1 Tax=Micromonospora coxensis TaxID=356852 RepID=UPI00342873D6
MSPDDAEAFADAVLTRAAELLLAEMRPQVEAVAAARQRRRNSAVTPCPSTGRLSGGSVVSLNAWRIRKSAAA